MAERFCKVCGDWHDLSQPWPAACVRVERDTRSSLPSPMIITDHMEPVQSVADGKTYDSKSGIRRSYRADGNPDGVEYIEVGNDPARLKPKKPVKPDRATIKAAVQKAAARWRNGERPAQD